MRLLIIAIILLIRQTSYAQGPAFYEKYDSLKGYSERLIAKIFSIYTKLEKNYIPTYFSEYGTSYGFLPYYLQFSNSTQKQRCQFVFSDENISGPLWSINDRNINEKTPTNLIQGGLGTVVCSNPLLSGTFHSKNGKLYTGQFFSRDSLGSYATGRFEAGYLIDTITIAHYNIHNLLWYEGLWSISDQPPPRYEASTPLLFLFKKLFPIDTTTMCTNMAFGYKVNAREYFLQAWEEINYDTAWDNSKTPRTITSVKKRNSQMQYRGYQRISGDNFVLTYANRNRGFSYPDLLEAAGDYRNYYLRSYSNKGIPYDIKHPVTILKGRYTREWVAGKGNLSQSGLQGEIGINVYLDENDKTLGAVYCPVDPYGKFFSYFVDSAYKGPGVRFIQQSPGGITQSIELKDFHPLKPKIKVIKDIRELLKTPADVWD